MISELLFSGTWEEVVLKLLGVMFIFSTALCVSLTVWLWSVEKEIEREVEEKLKRNWEDERND